MKQPGKKATGYPPRRKMWNQEWREEFLLQHEINMRQQAGLSQDPQLLDLVKETRDQVHQTENI